MLLINNPDQLSLPGPGHEAKMDGRRAQHGAHAFTMDNLTSSLITCLAIVFRLLAKSHFGFTFALLDV